MNGIKIIICKEKIIVKKLNIIGDNRGNLISIEKNEILDFDIKRIYYLFGTKENVSRGFHAHKKLNQILIAVSGSVEIKMYDGNEWSTFILSSPDQYIKIGPGCWREMHNFSPDCVLLVIADYEYDENDYIRNFEEFKKYVSKNT